MGISETFQTHLNSGATTLARCWQIERRDGVILGFTDHDRPLRFADTEFRADSGLTALALSQAAGLSVDNSEALGALRHDAIREDDIEAGRYDGAIVTNWLVNWTDVEDRVVLFRGSIGEIQRGAGGFRAELRGQTEALNQPSGRIYQKPCGAVLGDTACAFDVSNPDFSATVTAQEIEEGRVFRFVGLFDFAPDWFTRGSLQVKTGTAEGMIGSIKSDRFDEQVRVIELWSPIRALVEPADTLHLIAGCDKRFATCRFKFGNQLNFQGFPDIPGDDWISNVPKSGNANDGGSLR